MESTLLLQEIYDLIVGPWDDPVISDHLYYKIEKHLNDMKEKFLDSRTKSQLIKIATNLGYNASKKNIQKLKHMVRSHSYNELVKALQGEQKENTG